MWLANALRVFVFGAKGAAPGTVTRQYRVCACTQEDFERLLQMTGLQREIGSSPGADYPSCIIATPQEVFDIVSALAETIDSGSFESAVAAAIHQQRSLNAYDGVWSTLAAGLISPLQWTWRCRSHFLRNRCGGALPQLI
jgi:hypothetical protein